MSKEFKVQICEELSKIVTVEAENETEALEKVEELYKKSVIVLSADNYSNCSFGILKPYGVKFQTRKGIDEHTHIEHFSTIDDAERKISGVLSSFEYDIKDCVIQKWQEDDTIVASIRAEIQHQSKEWFKICTRLWKQ